ncbi:hypothetical protein L0B53_00140 [Vibrio sp. SS-MA-C1-2]|uniref:hypothetical protein n=1 Tax=Vibrio sp. SS-MA-C1-2 TaxID=2908646 RepID=UPI001F15D17A|nr:hypothetical protein [Vibrio sp. SS-MA-C1-2]UJF17221.1 hypothetical protein L0B53_00140 [Vibrio sp. SS-MA-C1-2]
MTRYEKRITRIEDSIITINRSDNHIQYELLEWYDDQRVVKITLNIEKVSTEDQNKLYIIDLFGNHPETGNCNKGYGSKLVTFAISHLKSMIGSKESFDLNCSFVGKLSNVNGTNECHARRVHFWSKTIGFTINDPTDEYSPMSAKLRDLNSGKHQVINLINVDCFSDKAIAKALAWSDKDEVVLGMIQRDLLQVKPLLCRIESYQKKIFNHSKKKSVHKIMALAATILLATTLDKILIPFTILLIALVVYNKQFKTKNKILLDSIDHDKEKLNTIKIGLNLKLKASHRLPVFKLRLAKRLRVEEIHYSRSGFDDLIHVFLSD